MPGRLWIEDLGSPQESHHQQSQRDGRDERVPALRSAAKLDLPLTGVRKNATNAIAAPTARMNSTSKIGTPTSDSFQHHLQRPWLTGMRRRFLVGAVITL
jgi:hypothetical protein